MTNPGSTTRAPARAGAQTDAARAQRRRMARALPLGSALAACLLLGAAAAVDGGAAILVLAGWVVLLAVAGVWLTTPRDDRPAGLPELVLADIDEDGELGEARHVRLLQSPAAALVLSTRPRG